jgi:hypothetical protein
VVVRVACGVWRQLEAQNQCALLARLLVEAGVDAWYDMDAERLEVRVPYSCTKASSRWF